jgi:hypothetical protein
MPNHDHEEDVQAHVFGRTSPDDPEEPESAPEEASAEGDQDDFEAHASAFGRPD